MPRKQFTAAQQAERVREILQRFSATYPDARCALNYSNPLELLIATILSAQCTDERVNIVTGDLFRKHCRPEDYLRVPQTGLENDIRSTGFFRNKAKNIQGACRLLKEKFGGRVPDTMEDLLLLPGVARKTANVVLGVAYGKAEGIVVDTHVQRISRRLELTEAETPGKIEIDLMSLIPRERWISFAHEAIFHGRRVCKARGPLCPACPVEKICRSGDKITAREPAPPVLKITRARRG
jgi:endonuclease-3